MIERYLWAMLAPILFLAALTVLVEARPVLADDETISVSCFKGNSDEGNYVGNVTVTYPTNAGQECNTTYYACDGQCLGCFTDPKSDQQVCYDKSGGKVAR